MADKVKLGRNTYNLLERLAAAVEDVADGLDRLNDNLEQEDD